MIRRMRCACWMTKTTNTHSNCVILIALPQQHWLRERTSLLHLYVHCLACQFMAWAQFVSAVAPNGSVVATPGIRQTSVEKMVSRYLKG